MSNKRFQELYKEVKSHSVMAEDKLRALYCVARHTSHIPGAVAECGIFRGGSLMLLATILSHKQVYGFDTFSGLPALGLADEESMGSGRYSCAYDLVRDYFKSTPNVELVQGLFPESASIVKDKTFSLVHLDMDLYRCTLDGLIFFYPRLNPGAILICDDYKLSATPGIERAFQEFFVDKQETYFAVGLRQVAFIKE